jgi:hypothetical protein
MLALVVLSVAGKAMIVLLATVGITGVAGSPSKWRCGCSSTSLGC